MIIFAATYSHSGSLMPAAQSSQGKGKGKGKGDGKGKGKSDEKTDDSALLRQRNKLEKALADITALERARSSTSRALEVSVLPFVEP